MNDKLSLTGIIQLFAGLPLTEMSYKDCDMELHLKKEGATFTLPLPSQAGQANAVAPSIVPHAVDNLPKSPADTLLHIVKSPLVGSFYRAPAPSQPDFVQVGQQVKKGQPLCIVEAMKVMNTIEADADGELVAIIPGNGDIVQYDSALFQIRRG